MDSLRLTLLIAGIVIVAGIYLYTRLSRRRHAAREDARGRAARESRPGTGNILDRRLPSDPDPGEIDRDVGDLGGIFTPRRETSDAELSVDVSVLAGLRASYESTIDGFSQTEDSEPHRSLDLTEPVDASEPHESEEPDKFAEPDEPAEAAEPAEPPVAAPQPPMPDMTRPLVYLALIAKDGRLAGSRILESLDAEGFRPGPLQLYYRQSDADPSIVFGIANQAEPGVLDPASLPGMETPGLVTFMCVPHDMGHALKTYNMMVAVGRRLARRLDARLCDETRSTLTAQTENHLREKVGEIVRRDKLEH